MYYLIGHLNVNPTFPKTVFRVIPLNPSWLSNQALLWLIVGTVNPPWGAWNQHRPHLGKARYNSERTPGIQEMFRGTVSLLLGSLFHIPGVGDPYEWPADRSILSSSLSREYFFNLPWCTHHSVQRHIPVMGYVSVVIHSITLWNPYITNLQREEGYLNNNKGTMDPERAQRFHQPF